MAATKHNVADLIWQSPGSEMEPLSLRLHAALSTLYTIEVEIKHAEPGLTFSDMLHAKAKIVSKIGPDLGTDRIYGGIITRFSQGRTRHGNLENAAKKSYIYHVEIRPSLWLSTRGQNTRVFQNMTAQAIVEDVVGSYGIAMDWQVAGELPERIYCVQYAESDYAFISRLLEDEGICFFFDQEAETVIFSDHIGGHPDVKPTAEATYVEEISRRMSFGKQEFISDFTYEETIGTGTFAQHHYNYETSQTDISAEDSEGEVPNFTELEQYAHSQNYVDGAQGSRYAMLRKEAATSWAKHGHGETTCRGFDVGSCFQMKKHFRDDLNVKWLLTETDIQIEQGRFFCRFGAQPADIPFRPAQKTPRPKVTGLQTATVTGPAGAEVYLDDLGRCKLQFHWDREGSKDDRSSMWVRVSNNYAGKDYGIQWIPRIGHEVVVTFIDGDPDLPLVTGRVYNDFNTPPLGPAQKYQNIIKTIKDNHLIFDDTDGAEMVDIRGQKDMTTLVMNDQSATIKNDRSVTVENDQTTTVVNNNTADIGVDQKVTVGSNESYAVGSDQSVSVGANQDVSIGADQSTQVGGSQKLTVLGSQTTVVNGSRSVSCSSSESKKVAGSQEVSVGANVTEVVGANQSVTVGGSQTVNVAANQTVSVGASASLNAGASIVANAGGGITLTCGASTISMTPGSITLNCGGSTISLTPGVTIAAAPILKLN